MLKILATYTNNKTMNIFYLHKDPAIAPTFLYNKHVVKMLQETAQMLCTTHYHYGNGDKMPYKKAYLKHPCTQWVIKSKQNYIWLWNYFMNINIEYVKRYNKIHKSWIRCRYALAHAPANMPDVQFTQPPQCMPDNHKEDCSVQAYWNYYIQEKKHVAKSSEEAWVFRPREIVEIVPFEITR